VATCFNRRHHRQPQQWCDSQNKASKKTGPTRWCTRICPMKNVPARRNHATQSFTVFIRTNSAMPITSAIVKTAMMSLSGLRNAIYALCSWSDKSCLYHFCTTVFEVNLKPSHVRTTHMLHVTLSSSRKAVAFRQHAQRKAFRRRDARPQSRWFAPRNPKLPPSPNSIAPC